MSLSLSLSPVRLPRQTLAVLGGPPSDVYHQSTAVFSQDAASGAFLRPRLACKLLCCQSGGGDVGGREEQGGGVSE